LGSREPSNTYLQYLQKRESLHGHDEVRAHTGEQNEIDVVDIERVYRLIIGDTPPRYSVKTETRMNDSRGYAAYGPIARLVRS
jgi:hypothetical protein